MVPLFLSLFGSTHRAGVPQHERRSSSSVRDLQSDHETYKSEEQCRRRRHSNGREKQSVKAKRRQHRPASSCTRKWNTCGVESTARDRQSRRSLSVCPRRGAPASNSGRRDRDRRRPALAGVQNAPIAPAKSTREDDRPRADRGRHHEPSSANPGAPHQNGLFQNKRVRPHAGVDARRRNVTPLDICVAVGNTSAGSPSD